MPSRPEEMDQVSSQEARGSGDGHSEGLPPAVPEMQVQIVTKPGVSEAEQSLELPGDQIRP